MMKCQSWWLHKSVEMVVKVIEKLKITPFTFWLQLSSAHQIMKHPVKARLCLIQRFERPISILVVDERMDILHGSLCAIKPHLHGRNLITHHLDAIIMTRIELTLITHDSYGFSPKQYWHTHYILLWLYAAKYNYQI